MCSVFCSRRWRLCSWSITYMCSHCVFESFTHKCTRWFLNNGCVCSHTSTHRVFEPIDACVHTVRGPVACRYIMKRSKGTTSPEMARGATRRATTGYRQYIDVHSVSVCDCYVNTFFGFVRYYYIQTRDISWHKQCLWVLLLCSHKESKLSVMLQCPYIKCMCMLLRGGHMQSFNQTHRKITVVVFGCVWVRLDHRSGGWRHQRLWPSAGDCRGGKCYCRAPGCSWECGTLSALFGTSAAVLVTRGVNDHLGADSVNNRHSSMRITFPKYILYTKCLALSPWKSMQRIVRHAASIWIWGFLTLAFGFRTMDIS